MIAKAVSGIHNMVINVLGRNPMRFGIAICLAAVGISFLSDNAYYKAVVFTAASVLALISLRDDQAMHGAKQREDRSDDGDEEFERTTTL
jgi:membrane protein implicated in regulation of membrane protease activity